MAKLKKRKYIGGCDTPEPQDGLWFESKHSIFSSLPIKLEWDYSPNSAHHLKHQGEFLDDDYPNLRNGNYMFRYLLKL